MPITPLTDFMGIINADGVNETPQGGS